MDTSKDMVENDAEQGAKEGVEVGGDTEKDTKTMHVSTRSDSSVDMKKNEEREFSLEDYPVREVEMLLFGFKDPVAFNPVVSALGVILLWGLAIWSMVDPEGSMQLLSDWRAGVTLNFTWLFVGSKAAFFFVLLFVLIKYGHVKMGGKDESPDYSASEYFSMIFAAGVAVGLFVYSVAEPLYHRTDNFFAVGYHTQDEIDQWALNITVTSWAINGWSYYLMVAVTLGLASHRFGLPMTFRSCFYPILGDYTWGWIGDVIDGLTIAVSVAGVCTSLGLGAIQIVGGFQYLGWLDPDLDEDGVSLIQQLTIWGITAIATASVISGLDLGVKYLSLFAFFLGMLLLFLVFVMDNTKYLLNLTVQETGYYIQHSLIELNFWTDAFAQLNDGEGRAIDGRAGAAWWMNAWAVFYLAWWVAWSAFVGMFVARISKGRTVGEVILYSLIAPTAYCILWFSIWGGIGIRQARQADELEKLGSTLFNDASHYLVDGSDFCYNVPQTNIYNETSGDLLFQNSLLGVTPVCQFDSSKAIDAAYNVLYSFSYPKSLSYGLGPTLTVIFIIALAVYFATSSDSGSLVVDHLSSNGRKNHHWIQRLFWALTEGAVATALLAAGGTNALYAVQAASIVFGLPFAFILCYLCETLITFASVGASDADLMEFKLSEENTFSMPVYGGIFNLGEYLFSFGRVNPKRIERGMDLPTSFQVIEFFKATFFPFISLYQVLSAAYPRSPMTNMAATAAYALFFAAWVSLFCAYGAVGTGLLGWAWSFFFCAGCLLCSLRAGFRGRYNIRSNIVGDFISSLFFWPQVMTQMRLHCMELGLPNDKKDEDVKEEEIEKLDQSSSD